MVPSAKKGQDVTVQLTGVEAKLKTGRIAAKSLTRSGARVRGKHRREELRGEEFAVSGQLVEKVRVIDREKNYYHEHVKDAETGEILRDVEHRLTDHTGRGSERKPRK